MFKRAKNYYWDDALNESDEEGQDFRRKSEESNIARNDSDSDSMELDDPKLLSKAIKDWNNDEEDDEVNNNSENDSQNEDNQDEELASNSSESSDYELEEEKAS